MTTKRETSAPVSRRRAPNLYLGESLLARAFGAIEELDPELALPAEEHAAIIRTFVDPEALAAKRDEFVDFVKDVAGVIDEKRERAKELLATAAAMESRVERMTQGLAHTMDAQGAKELHGEAWTIVLRKSPGAVEVLDENQVPAEFKRVKESVWLTRVRGLVDQVRRLATSLHSNAKGIVDEEGFASCPDVVHANDLLTECEDEARVVDKTAIRDFWKEHGDTKHVVDVPTLNGELAMTEASQVTVPTVPGTRKVVTLKLEFK